MAKMTSSNITDPKIWAALNLRVSLFFESHELIHPEPLWSKIFGGEPQNQTRKPSEYSLVEDGVFKLSSRTEDPDAMLQVALKPGRSDLLVSPILDAGKFSENAFPTIGQYDSNCEKFLEIAKGWIEIQDKQITRIAYGAILALVVEDRARAYKALDELLPAIDVTNDENVTDFSYTINRRRRSVTVPDILINRLSTWRSLRQKITVTLGDDLRKNSENDFVFLELDINTHVSNTKKIENTSDLIEELQTLAVEISEHGEIP